MIKYIIILFLCISTISTAQNDINAIFKKHFKFATFYGAINGGTSISDAKNFSVTTGQLQEVLVETPYDYSVSVGVRKIARFGYENRANTFYDGTETSWSDAATIGKVSGLEFLLEADYSRKFGENYLDQHHFIRYVADTFIVKLEYLQDGFADVEYFETSERYRYKINNKLSFNIGAAQRIAEPYGYNPLEQWVLSNGDIHYTYLAIQEGYNIDVFNNEYYDPQGNLVATSKDVWESVIIPNILADYVEKKRNELPAEWNYSLVLGFDYYHYTKTFWLHSWCNVLPYHLDLDTEYSYHKYNNNEQWYDYSGGLILGYKLNKHLGVFVEGKYNKYWNRQWHDFKFGINYIIF